MFTIIIILSDTELFSWQQYLISAIIYFIKTETQPYLTCIDMFEDVIYSCDKNSIFSIIIITGFFVSFDLS